MTIHVELGSDIEASLTAEATAHGMAIEEYAQVLLRKALRSSTSRRGHLTPEEAREMLRQMGEGSEKLPLLPISAFSRESFYEGR